MKVTQNLPEVGKRYAVDHSRKGRFVMDIVQVDGELVTGTLVSGNAEGILRTWWPGDTIVVRAAMATFTEVTPT